MKEKNSGVIKMSARKFTNLVIENVEQGLISWESVARSALVYMSEADVEDMAKNEGLLTDEQSDDDE